MEGCVELSPGGEGVAIRHELLRALAGALARPVPRSAADLWDPSVRRRAHRLHELLVELPEGAAEGRHPKRTLEGPEQFHRGFVPAVLEQSQGELQERGEMVAQGV